jgi:hypothetical protein
VETLPTKETMKTYCKRILAKAQKELDTARPLGYVLTNAEYKRRLYLINHEKDLARFALGLEITTAEPLAELQGDLF